MATIHGFLWGRKNKLKEVGSQETIFLVSNFDNVLAATDLVHPVRMAKTFTTTCSTMIPIIFDLCVWNKFVWKHFLKHDFRLYYNILKRIFLYPWNIPIKNTGA